MHYSLSLTTQQSFCFLKNQQQIAIYPHKIAVRRIRTGEVYVVRVLYGYRYIDHVARSHR